MREEEQEWDVVLEMLLETPASHPGTPGVKSQLCSPFLLPANAQAWKQQVMAVMIGPPPSIPQETWIVLLTAGGLAQAWTVHTLNE